jgi:hypothetical protein
VGCIGELYPQQILSKTVSSVWLVDNTFGENAFTLLKKYNAFDPVKVFNFINNVYVYLYFLGNKSGGAGMCDAHVGIEYLDVNRIY